MSLMPYNFLCVQAGGMLASLRTLEDVFSFTTLLQLATIAVVALGPSFLLKRNNTFRDSFREVDTTTETKKSQ
ncbi:Transmembrane protein 41A [Homalodisca vitripennis]|nr:Transmembrane protein 41A [Homalodisca vitripennis]